MNSSTHKPSVTVIVPSYNEEKNIEKIIKNIKKIPQYDIDLLVAIDSKTTDNTEKIARENGARVLLTKKTKGKGDVIRQAIKHIKGDYAIQIDADSQFLPKDIPKLINPLLNGYDVTLGTRYQKGAKVEVGSVSLLKKIGSYGLSLAASIAAKQTVTDVMAGFKAFKTPVLKKLKPTTSHFGYEAELVIRSAQLKYRILNVPIEYKKREIGTSTVNSLKHGILVLATIIKTSLAKKT